MKITDEMLTDEMRVARDSTLHCFPTEVSPISGIPHDHVNRYKLLNDLISKFGCQEVLDLGCGTGYGACLLSSSISYTGVEYSNGAVAFARKFIQPYLPHVAFFREDMVTYIIKAISSRSKFGMVSLVESIDHVSEEGQRVVIDGIKELAQYCFISCLRRPSIREVERSYGDIYGHELSHMELLELVNPLGKVIGKWEQEYISPEDCWVVRVNNQQREFNENLEHISFQQILVDVEQ